jgi:hypothetical protein
LFDLTLLSTTKQQAVATGTGSKNLAEYLSFNNEKTYTGLDGYGQANPHDDTRNFISKRARRD